MIINPIEWLRSHYTPEQPIHTGKHNKIKDFPFFLTGGSAIRVWPSKDIARPLNANITCQIKAVKGNFQIQQTNVPVHISNICARDIFQAIERMGQVDPYLSGLSVQHFSIHGDLFLPKVSTDNTKLVLVSLKGAKIVPNLWFDKDTKTVVEEDEVSFNGSSGVLSMSQVVAANRTLVYRGKRIENVPLKVNKGNILFLGVRYKFETFIDDILTILEEKELMTPSNKIALPKLAKDNKIVYERALHYLCSQAAEYNNIQFTRPMPAVHHQVEDVVVAE